MRRLVPVLFVFTLVALGVGGYLFFSEYTRVFPELQAGVYAGTLSSSDGSDPVPLLVDVRPGGSEVFVSIGDDKIPAQRVLVAEPSRGTRLPLIVTGEGRRLRLTGEGKSHGLFAGEYVDPISSKKGEWTLHRMSVGELRAEDKQVLSAWGTVWATQDAVDARIKQLKRGVDQADARLVALRQSANDAARARTQEKLPNGTSSANESKDKPDELLSLIQSFEVGQKVSPAGRLVALSRESIQRDAAWIENALHLAAPEVSGDFEAQYERALRVKAIQDQIADERGLLKNLQEAPIYRENESKADDEEAFYNGLR